MFRITGDRTALESALAESGLPFVESVQSQRERRKTPNTPYPNTTFDVAVSDASGDSVPEQITEADAFLASNEHALKAIVETVPRCEWSIDFSWDFPRDAIGQFNGFPSQFLSRLAQLDITLVVSVYGTAPTTEDLR